VSGNVPALDSDDRALAAGERPSFVAIRLKLHRLFHKRIELYEREEKAFSSERAFWNSARQVCAELSWGMANGEKDG
jgi:hypothetical protein